MEEEKAYCEQHELEYTLQDLGFGIFSSCPKCEEEKALIKQEEEQERLREEQERLKKYEHERLLEAYQVAKIPKRYFDKANYSLFSKQQKELLNNGIEGNYFISGNVGAGKTTFLSELLKNNIEYKPMYLDCSKLFILNEKDYKLTNFIDSFSECAILAIDEVQYMYNNTFLLDIVISECYNNKTHILISGNTTLQEFNTKLPARIVSRFTQDLKHKLQFNSNDLRMK